jgi:hypothetical protein
MATKTIKQITSDLSGQEIDGEAWVMMVENGSQRWHLDISAEETEPFVDKSVYGYALTFVCATRTPRAIIEPCAELKAVLSGGVSDDDLGDLDDAVQKLNLALGLTSPDES